MYPATRETNARLVEDQRRRAAEHRRQRWLHLALQAACAACILLIPAWLLYDASRQGQRWEKYKAEHRCVLRYMPGEAGPPTEPSGSEGWLCAGPRRMIWKIPAKPGVAGQI